MVIGGKTDEVNEVFVNVCHARVWQSAREKVVGQSFEIRQRPDTRVEFMEIKYGVSRRFPGRPIVPLRIHSVNAIQCLTYVRIGGHDQIIWELAPWRVFSDRFAEFGKLGHFVEGQATGRSSKVTVGKRGI